MPLTGPDAVELEMVPLVRPTKPPTTLFGPVLVTAPWALEFVISPGPFWKLSVPMNPPSTLLPPPVTAPIAELATIVPLLVPAKPPATLESPTVTLPLANDDVIDPAPRLKTFWPTSPPTRLNAPPLTLPLADESRDGPEIGGDQSAGSIRGGGGIGISDADSDGRAGVGDEADVLTDQTAYSDAGLGAAADAAAQRVNVADGAAVLARERTYECGTSRRDVNVGEVDVAHRRAAPDYGEQRGRQVADRIVGGADPAIAVECPGKSRPWTKAAESGSAEALAYRISPAEIGANELQVVRVVHEHVGCELERLLRIHEHATAQTQPGTGEDRWVLIFGAARDGGGIVIDRDRAGAPAIVDATEQSEIYCPCSASGVVGAQHEIAARRVLDGEGADIDVAIGAQRQRVVAAPSDAPSKGEDIAVALELRVGRDDHVLGCKLGLNLGRVHAVRPPVAGRTDEEVLRIEQQRAGRCRAARRH